MSTTDRLGPAQVRLTVSELFNSLSSPVTSSFESTTNVMSYVPGASGTHLLTDRELVSPAPNPATKNPSSHCTPSRDMIQLGCTKSPVLSSPMLATSATISPSPAAALPGSR